MSIHATRATSDLPAPHMAAADAGLLARDRSPYTTRQKIGRLIWALVQATLFRYSFTTWYAWRAFLLRRFGTRIGVSTRIRRTAHFECPWNVDIGDNVAIGDHAIIYALGPITIGNRVCISQYAHLCAGSHDFTRYELPLLRPPIVLEDDVWLGADCFIGPGITVRRGALVGARASAFSNLEPWTVYVCNPARPLKPRPPMEGAPPHFNGQ